MQINLAEKLKPSLENQVDVIVELSVVGDLLLYNSCVVENAGNLNLALIDLSMDRVTI